jgi:hypothetical protein
MDTLVSGLISTGLFVAFVPGVLVRLPPGGTKTTVLLVHAVLFAVVASLVMRWYWNMRENMGNYGAKCPNGYMMLPDQSCVPVGHATYPTTGVSA